VDEGAVAAPAHRTLKLKLPDKTKKLADAGVKRLNVALKDLEVLELRRSGLSIPAIAEATGLDAKEVKATVDRCLQVYFKELSEAADDIRLLESYRLDGVLEKLWPQRDDPRAADSILKVMDRRAKLLGLDAIAKSEVNVTGLENMTDEQIAEQIKNLAAVAAAAPKKE
jgi:hypothetical protein